MKIYSKLVKTLAKIIIILAIRDIKKNSKLKWLKIEIVYIFACHRFYSERKKNNLSLSHLVRLFYVEQIRNLSVQIDHPWSIRSTQYA